MKKCSIIDEFMQNKRKYMQYKHQFSKKSNDEKVQKVLKFLQFCCSLDIKRIKDINKSHYDDFIRLSISDKSLETQRKYRLALSEFVERASLGFKIAKNVDRQKEKKLNKILQILNVSDISKEQKSEILKII